MIKSGKGSGEGSKATQFVAKANCSACDVLLTTENKRFGKCLTCSKTANLARVLAYNARNPDKVKECARKTDKKRAQGPDRKSDMRMHTKIWTLLNPERVKASHAIRQSRRRARKAMAGGNVTQEEWLEQLEVFGHRCAYCLEKCDKLQMEHVIPIARGGPHTIDNVVPSCGPCNFRKYDRGPLALVNRMFEKAV
jgi:5-methylcytosine-specific restriction endonuclease McrA